MSSKKPLRISFFAAWTKFQMVNTLYKKWAKPHNLERKTRLPRQIDATGRQIDKLVYDLYGLTEDDITIVEEEMR